jgi:hypothetical protein
MFLTFLWGIQQVGTLRPIAFSPSSWHTSLGMELKVQPTVWREPAQMWKHFAVQCYMIYETALLFVLRLGPLVLLVRAVLRWRWVWSNGGMILTGENWSTGRKILYSVGGRWMNEYGAMVEWYWQGKTEVLGGRLPSFPTCPSEFPSEFLCGCFRSFAFTDNTIIIQFTLLFIYCTSKDKWLLDSI